MSPKKHFSFVILTENEMRGCGGAKKVHENHVLMLNTMAQT
jgi:hypothetical protein